MQELSQGSAFVADTFKSAKAKVTGGEKKEA
jgi:hypothetical protein